MSLITTTIPTFVWPLHDPITKSFVDTVQSFLLQIHQELNQIQNLPTLQQQTHIFSQQFRALLETYLYQLKVALEAYQDDYQLLAEDDENKTKNTKSNAQYQPHRSTSYISRQSLTLYANNIQPQDFFAYIQTCESIKHIVQLFEVLHLDPNENITAQFLNWFHSSHPIPLEYQQFLAAAGKTTHNNTNNLDNNDTTNQQQELLSLPFGRDINSDTYWFTCATLLSQGRVVELTQLLDINPHLELKCGIGELNWKDILLHSVLFSPVLGNLLTDYTATQYNIDIHNSCCMMGSLGLCNDPQHIPYMSLQRLQSKQHQQQQQDQQQKHEEQSNSNNNQDDQNQSNQTSSQQDIDVSSKPTDTTKKTTKVTKRRKFGLQMAVADDHDDNDNDNNTTKANDKNVKSNNTNNQTDTTPLFNNIPLPPFNMENSTPIWSKLNFEERFNAWQTQLNTQLIPLGESLSTRFTMESPFKLLIVLTDIDNTAVDLFLTPIVENLKLQPKYQLEHQSTWIPLSLYMILFRFPTITRSGIADIFKESFGSVIEFLDDQVQQKLVSKANVNKYRTFLEDDQIGDVVHTVGTHSMLHSLFMIETLINYSTKQAIKILQYNFSSNQSNLTMGDDDNDIGIDDGSVQLIDKNTMRTLDSNDFVSIFGFDWLLAVLAEFVFHTSKIDPDFIQQDDDTNMSNDSNENDNINNNNNNNEDDDLFKTNKKLQKINNDLKKQLQYPYLLPFFPPTHQLKNPPMDLRQRYLYRYIDGIVIGLYSSRDYIKILSKVYNKEYNFVCKYIDDIYNYVKLDQFSTAQYTALCNSYNEIDSTMSNGLKSMNIIIHERDNVVNNSQIHFKTPLQFNSFITKDASYIITRLFNQYYLGHNPLYIHLLPHATLNSSTKHTLLQPYQDRIINNIVQIIKLRFNLPIYIYQPDDNHSLLIKDLTSSTTKSHQQRLLSFSASEQTNFITLLQHQIVTHNTTQVLSTDDGDDDETIATHELGTNNNQDDAIAVDDHGDNTHQFTTTTIKPLSLSISQINALTPLGDANFRTQLSICLKYILFSQLLSSLYRDYFIPSSSRIVWSFSFLRNPHIQVAISATIDLLNAQVQKYNLPLPSFAPLDLSKPPATFTIDEVATQFNTKSPLPSPLVSLPTILHQAFALNNISILTFLFEHIISASYHNDSIISTTYKNAILTTLAQISTTTSNSGIIFNIPTVCEQWDSPFLHYLTTKLSTPQAKMVENDDGTMINNYPHFSPVASLPFPQQPMSPSQYLYSLYLLAQFWILELVLYQISPLTRSTTNNTTPHTTPSTQSLLLSSSSSSILQFIAQNPLLLTTIPKTIDEFVKPRDTITFALCTQQNTNNNDDEDNNNILSNVLSPQSYASNLFTTLFNVLLELLQSTFCDYHKLALFTFFGLYMQLIQIHAHLQLISDVDNNNNSIIGLNQHDVYSFFTSMQQQNDVKTATFSLPASVMIEFQRYKDETLMKVIIAYNSFITMKQLNTIKKFIQFSYLSPQRYLWLLPSSILSLHTSAPLILELIDNVPHRVLQMDNYNELVLQTNSKYIIGHLVNYFIPQESTSTHPLFPTEAELTVNEERDYLAFFVNLLMTNIAADTSDNNTTNTFEPHQYTADGLNLLSTNKWTQLTQGLCSSREEFY